MTLDGSLNIILHKIIYYSMMDCLEILSSFFKYLSEKSCLKLEFTFESFEETKFSEADRDILENIKKYLVNSCFDSTKNDFNDFVKTSKFEQKSLKSKIICEICKKKFAHPKLRDFHFGVCHSQEFCLPLDISAEENLIGENRQ